MFFCVFFEKSIISRFRFQVYTRLNYLKFEIPKIFWGGAHRAPSPDPSPALSRASQTIRASPSNLGRFALSIRASPDSDPPTFEPPSPDPSPRSFSDCVLWWKTSSSIRASPSNLGRFAPSIRASPDLDPPTFEAWLRPCSWDMWSLGVWMTGCHHHHHPNHANVPVLPRPIKGRWGEVSGGEGRGGRVTLVREGERRRGGEGRGWLNDRFILEYLLISLYWSVRRTGLS